MNSTPLLSNRHRGSRRAARRRAGGWRAAGVLLVTVCALTAVWGRGAAPLIDAAVNTLAAPLPAAPAPPRTAFRHSVVPGGVYTANEAQAAVDADQVVAAHYAGVTPGALRPEIVDADRRVYMSYRVGNQIYWTKHKVLLREGETVLTDGVHEIRARCGNCISLEPMQPTADNEPHLMEFDSLVDSAAIARAEDDSLPMAFDSLVETAAIARADHQSLPIAFDGLGDSGAVLPSRPRAGMVRQMGDDQVTSVSPESSPVRGGGMVGVGGIPLVDPTSGAAPDSLLQTLPDVLDDPSGVPPPFAEDGPVGGDDDTPLVLALVPDSGNPDSSNPDGGERSPDDPIMPGLPTEIEGPADPPAGRGDPGNPLEDITPVPEPGTLLLVGGGIGALYRRRQRRLAQLALRDGFVSGAPRL